MSLGLVGRKIGMTRVFTEDGSSLPVTVLEVSNNRITQVKTVSIDGYSAVQVAHGVRRPGRVTKAAAGHYAKAGVEAGSSLREFTVFPEQLNDLQTGSTVSVEIFKEGQLVDVTGVSKGKGYAGSHKRHNFKSGRASHGNSKSHNVPGSIGMAQDPGRVFPGKRMTGHLGDVRKTVQNLQIVRVDVARQLLLVKGAVPGATNGKVIVRPAVKAGA
ncbi:MAG: 50S ribosomal protein L3 [Gallionellales bacterium CG_4_10_14_3_um_filter_54_96]|nr:50S ribosomal protein L3 [Gallionella sp.]OIO80188.1 MAG: 50S ribosomal protein L3 [Gallionellaceae bacterium CG1_02_56_997]PIV14676.1 MAG: 50S ribosomal protein L3 [Gallionellales bacterium CG03_land_8_20_14_0_80_55_15]PIV91195.1 MAG: 50S ribosomal protein L3 [Gallionellales bacterium CG17_big_fil_post_rev_8_21_14_2_50_54_146]PIY06388.1 MAG: 50S ribosomal protein L3 [Gallionellales bacterium CG_4_10_14_3_um_filter_54_96]